MRLALILLTLLFSADGWADSPFDYEGTSKNGKKIFIRISENPYDPSSLELYRTLAKNHFNVPNYNPQNPDSYEKTGLQEAIGEVKGNVAISFLAVCKWPDWPFPKSLQCYGDKNFPLNGVLYKRDGGRNRFTCIKNCTQESPKFLIETNNND